MAMETEIPAPAIDAFERLLSYLVCQRQRLRQQGASESELEANRQAIISTQDRMNRALIRRHTPKT